MNSQSLYKIKAIDGECVLQISIFLTVPKTILNDFLSISRTTEIYLLNFLEYVKNLIGIIKYNHVIINQTNSAAPRN